jgi:hypothetical protein
MKKLAFTFMALAFIATAIHAQSLVDNSYYLESVRLTEEATKAYDDGDYDTARELALLAQENARLSDEYVAEMLAMQKADEAIIKAQERYDYAESIDTATRYPVAFTGATESLAAAYAAYGDSKYDEARIRAGYVLDYLAGITEEKVVVFPATYTVRKLDYKTDCLWRIAEMPFVYNDPMQWPLLYRANLSIMPDSKNPDLIEPGMVLTIPPLAGETREGNYVEGVEYPTMGK